MYSRFFVYDLTCRQLVRFWMWFYTSSDVANEAVALGFAPIPASLRQYTAYRLMHELYCDDSIDADGNKLDDGNQLTGTTTVANELAAELGTAETLAAFVKTAGVEACQKFQQELLGTSSEVRLTTARMRLPLWIWPDCNCGRSPTRTMAVPSSASNHLVACPIDPPTPSVHFLAPKL